MLRPPQMAAGDTTVGIGPHPLAPRPHPHPGARTRHAWSPEQIARRLRLDFPDDGTMRISHEAIYQALYVRGRGALRRELTACLRTGRALRVPRARSRGEVSIQPGQAQSSRGTVTVPSPAGFTSSILPPMLSPQSRPILTRMR